MNIVLLYRLGAVSLVLTGITLWIDAFLEAAFPEMTFGLCFLVSTLGLFGLTTIFFYQGEKAKRLGLPAYLLSFIGLCGILGIAFNNNIYSLVIDPIKLEMMIKGPSHTIFIASGIVFMIGSALLSASIWLSGRFQKVTSLMYFIGTIPLALPTVIGKPYVELGAVMTGLAVLMWGMKILASTEEIEKEVIV